MNRTTIEVKDIDEMRDFAKILADYFSQKPGIIFLDGDLGAGKTTFTQFFAKFIGINDIVTSPTFNIFKRYETKDVSLNHFDLYRIRGEVYDQGFEEYWFSNEISIIEWSVYLPDEFKDMFTLKMMINSIDEHKRNIEITCDDELQSYIKGSL